MEAPTTAPGAGNGATAAPAGRRRSGARGAGVPRASLADTFAVAGEVVAPLVARGVIVRRRGVMDRLEGVDADRRAVRRMQRLREHYGPGPLLLRVPGRELALILSPEHVDRVLDGSPEPFAPASREKRAALNHFQTDGVLVSHGFERADRRRFNEQVLETERRVHGLADALVAAVREEADGILGAARATGALAYDDFEPGWWRMVRRVVLGAGAREDHELTDLLTALRSDANWAFAKPKRRRLRERFWHRLATHLERAEETSLAAMIASTQRSEHTEPLQQVPQWLFAFDAAAMATFTALALLDASPDHALRAREELEATDTEGVHELPLLRASVLEAVRLWHSWASTAPTEWESGRLPEGAGVMIFAPFFHRDDERLADADRFAPELWLDGRTSQDWPLIPFSGGPAECAGRNLVLLLTSTMLGALLERAAFRQEAPAKLEDPDRLPATLSPFSLRFGVVARDGD